VAKAPSKKPSQRTKHHASNGKLQLLGIRLVESNSRLGELKKDQLPGHATQALNVTIITPPGDANLVVVNVRIKLDASYDGDQTKEPAMSILANFVADYAIVDEFPDKDVFQKFIATIGLAHIWPYWREFAQSITTRMGLPAFPIPLINTNELTKDASDEKNKN